MKELQKIEYPVYFKTYIDTLEKDRGLLEQLEDSLELFEQILYELDEDKYEYRYQEGKWT
ncbi:MAG: DinB family protein, partial [Flavobacteriales bacterium]|nr:DinB family protein [Flavobacteriales bacterium]